MIIPIRINERTWLKLWDEAAAFADDPEAPKPPSPPPNDCEAALAFEA